MNSEKPTGSGEGVQMLERVVAELSERLKLTEKQLRKTHRIAVEALRAAGDGPKAMSIDDDSTMESESRLPDQADETKDSGSPGSASQSEESSVDDGEQFDDAMQVADPDEADRANEPPEQWAESPAAPASSAEPPPAVPPDASPPPHPAQAAVAAAQATQPPFAVMAQQPSQQQPQFLQAQSNSAGAGEWESIWLGDPMTSLPGIDADRRALVAGLRCGEPAAGVLVGTMLVFRNSTPDRMAQMLKDIGEAYYRWRPETAATHDLFRQSLIESLHSLCESASVFNRIELVQPGDRFDSTRHHCKTRGGMEVAEVQGWVVLRENGKPYTKANVTVQ